MGVAKLRVSLYMTLECPPSGSQMACLIYVVFVSSILV